MTKDEFNSMFDELITADSIDLNKADEFKANLNSVFDTLEEAQSNNTFYASKIDDLTKQNKALYLRTKPTEAVQTVPQEPEKPTKTPYEIFSEAMGDYIK